MAAPSKHKKKRDEDLADLATNDENTDQDNIKLPSMFDASGIGEEVADLLKFSTYEPEYRYWLDTGSKYLNRVFGAKKLGIPYGKILELAGAEHGGKTALSLIVAGMAQRDGAAVGYIDLEDSRDDVWSTKLGLDYSKIYPVYPKLIYAAPKKKKAFGSSKVKESKKGRSKDIPRLQSAEELFAEAEMGMYRMWKSGAKKQFWLLDSLANLQPEDMIEAGATGQNANTRSGRSRFLSETLPRFAGLCANYNATMFIVNQLRDRIGQIFGDPSYSPGGRAVRHSCAIRARVRRLKNGKMRQGSKVVGIIGAINNFKNKAGKGSIQDAECGFRIKWSTDPAMFEFMSVDDAKELVG